MNNSLSVNITCKKIDVLEKSTSACGSISSTIFHQLQTIHVHKFAKEFLMLENSKVEGKE